ncbi:MAG: hypothetical protein KQI81_19995 [Deltaproteobacteria bacterium]|nr:hypothetical protein [Deltaproteobacteria bacterium]
MNTKMKGKRSWLNRFNSETLFFVTVLAIFIFASTPAVFALTGADAVILNVVRVDYTDASGNQNFSAEAAAMVTVSLVEAGVTISGRPTLADPGTGATIPAEQTVASGITASYLYAITSSANGDDEYYLDVAIDAWANAANRSVTTQLLTPDELGVIANNPGSVTLEASVIIDATAPATLFFPGGTLTGLAAGQVLVVDGVDYLVDSVTAGSSASHTYADGFAHSDDLGTLTAETRVQVVLAANPSGANVPPAFDATFVGMSAYEQVLFRVQVSAEADTAGIDGTVDVDVRTATDVAFTANLVDLQDVTTTYTAVNLTIQKLVRNVTTGGGFAATANGVTTNVLEYQVTITNNAGDAANVVVTDDVPDYTTLVVSGGNFASYTGPSGSGTITSITGAENLPDGVSGEHTGTAAGVPLVFYVGQGQDGAAGTGGVVLNGQTFVITYQVSIN